MTGKRRIRHHDVSLLQKFDALFASEVAIPFELFDLDLLVVDRPVPVSVAVVNELDAAPVLLIACSDEFLKSQCFEINLKVLYEIRLSCVVAVAVDYFVFEVFFIMF